METENNFDCINLRHFLKKKLRKLKNYGKKFKRKVMNIEYDVISKNLYNIIL